MAKKPKKITADEFAQWTGGIARIAGNIAADESKSPAVRARAANLAKIAGLASKLSAAGEVPPEKIPVFQQKITDLFLAFKEAQKADAGAPVEQAEAIALHPLAETLVDLANATNPPLTDARLDALLPSLPTDAQALVVEGRAVFLGQQVADADAVWALLDQVPGGVRLEPMALSLLAEQVEGVVGDLFEHVVGPLAQQQDAPPEQVALVTHAGTVAEGVAQAVAAARSASDEIGFRHALRRGAISPLWDLTVQLAQASGQPTPNVSMPSDQTAREAVVTMEQVRHEQVRQPADTAVGGPGLPVPSSPDAEGFVLWVPDPTRADPKAKSPFGSDDFGDPVGVTDPGFKPFAAKADAAALGQRFYENAILALQDASVTGLARHKYELRTVGANYSVQPFTTQPEPQIGQEAADESIPSLGMLVSLLDQYAVPMDWHPDYGEPYPLGVYDVLDTLHDEFGNLDFFDLLADAVVDRQKGAAATDPGRSVWWTNVPPTVTRPDGSTVQMDLPDAQVVRDSTMAVNGATWTQVSLRKSLEQQQFALWRAAGEVLDEASFETLKAKDTTLGNVEGPVTPPDRSLGIFLVREGVAYVDSALLGMLESTPYALMDAGTEEPVILSPDNATKLRCHKLLDDLCLAGGAYPYFRLTQDTPAHEPPEQGPGIFTFLADVEAMNIGSAAAGSTPLVEAVQEEAEANGGVTVEHLFSLLRAKYLNEWVPQANEMFGASFTTALEADEAAVHLTLTHQKDTSDPQSPAFFLINVTMVPEGDDVTVTVRLKLVERAAGAEPKTMVLEQALDPKRVLHMAQQHYLMIRGGKPNVVVEEALKDSNERRDDVYRDNIIGLALSVLRDSTREGSRGLSIIDTDTSGSCE